MRSTKEVIEYRHILMKTIGIQHASYFIPWTQLFAQKMIESFKLQKGRVDIWKILKHFMFWTTTDIIWGQKVNDFVKNVNYYDSNGTL